MTPRIIGSATAARLPGAILAPPFADAAPGRA